MYRNLRFSIHGGRICTVIAIVFTGSSGNRRTPYYYRTEDGAEVDLLFERAGRVDMAIEIKRSSSPALSKGFHAGCEVLKPRSAYVVHGAAEGRWPASKGVEAISLRELMTVLVK